MKSNHYLANATCFLYAILFVSCSEMIQNANYTHHWSGSDVPGHLYATFDGFNGKQDFNAKKFAASRVLVKYSAELKEGSMHLDIICSKKTVLSRDIQNAIRDSVSFDNPGHEPVKFIFRAKNAAGKFDISY
jgi:hypothetical protein